MLGAVNNVVRREARANGKVRRAIVRDVITLWRCKTAPLLPVSPYQHVRNTVAAIFTAMPPIINDEYHMSLHLPCEFRIA